jgi:hypothetical protein
MVCLYANDCVYMFRLEYALLNYHGSFTSYRLNVERDSVACF